MIFFWPCPRPLLHMMTLILVFTYPNKRRNILFKSYRKLTVLSKLIIMDCHEYLYLNLLNWHHFDNNKIPFHFVVSRHMVCLSIILSKCFSLQRGRATRASSSVSVCLWTWLNDTTRGKQKLYRTTCNCINLMPLESKTLQTFSSLFSSTLYK